jgi:hypothetical protein
MLEDEDREEICSLNSLLAISTEPINCFRIQTEEGEIAIAVATNGWTIRKLEAHTTLIAQWFNQMTPLENYDGDRP